MTFETVQIRGTHPYTFRTGEWARLCGMTFRFIPGSESRDDTYRWCYVVLFPDGKDDYWPVVDSMEHYEFRTVKEER